MDELFESWNRNDSPGCALAIIQNGTVVYKKGYGMANLEYAAPIQTDTIFHVASVSKQFTAFAVHLLASEEMLSLDDDIRKYLPELHDFGQVITIRHLLHHTSGLRDQWDLLALAGWREGDVMTEDDILSLAWRQRELNFQPGAEELYSNTGYTLLGLIVRRVSGKTLREFCQERIFAPLGMSHTHFHDDNTELVQGRAYCYTPRSSGGFNNAPLQYATVGATSLFTTVEDMAKWDSNFSDIRVGSASILAAVLQGGKLSSGAEIGYASGLMHGEYRGLKTIGHGGSDAGYRSEYLRFPDAHFTVVILANTSSLSPGSLARKVANTYLADRLSPATTEQAEPPAPTSTEKTIDPKMLDAYIGTYQLHPDLMLTFSCEGEHLIMHATGRGQMEIAPLSETEFRIKGMDVRLRFTLGKDGKAECVGLDEGGGEMLAPRIERVTPKQEQLSEYAGLYFSKELDVVYRLFRRGNDLILRHPRGEVVLEPAQRDVFIGAYPIGRIHFTRDAGNSVHAFRLTCDRVRNLLFDRLAISPEDA